MALLMAGNPISGIVGGPLSGYIVHYFPDGQYFAGWQWLFVLEAIPAAILGVVVFFVLDDQVAGVTWLTAQEKAMVADDVRHEGTTKTHHTIGSVFTSWRVWLMCSIYFSIGMGSYALGFWQPTIISQTGGLPALMRELREFLDLTALNISGGTLGDSIALAEEVPGQDVIRSVASPLKKEGAMAVLYGNLAPQSALIKQSAASPKLMQHTGRAVVFDSVEDMGARIDLPDLDVGPDDILVLRNAGPKGAPGMPEAGYLPIPMKLARAGVKDMVRISDARMSGTAFGTIVLHITPESAVGGPLAVVETGDMMRLDVEARRIELLIDEVELERRLAAWKLLPPHREMAKRGYAKLFEDSVLQANEGCDFDFLLREGGAELKS